MNFKVKMERSSRDRRSRIVLALDLYSLKSEKLISKSLEILECTQKYVCAVKINRHLILPLGLHDGVRKILDATEDFGLPSIMDCKINDIGYTNQIIAEEYFKAGFDAITANPFIGWDEGLKPVFDKARKLGKGIILLVYMSHKAAVEGYGQRVIDPFTGEIKPQYIVFARRALLWGADGAVVGATYPEKINEVFNVLKNRVPVYSPGVGTQGGSGEAAIKSGARFLIIGRSIVKAKDPAEAAKSFKDKIANLCRQ